MSSKTIYRKRPETAQMFPDSYVEALTLDVMVFVDVAFGNLIVRVSWDYEGGTLMMGLMAL